MRPSPSGIPRASHGRASRERVAVIGGGIVGLAHAWAAARRGAEVLLFERNHRAQGASVRSFGLVWPIGQPNGPLHRTALRSRELWLELLAKTGMWHRQCGSLHLAYRDDEWAVLSEFAQLAPQLGYECELLSPADVSERSPAARQSGLCGGLWSPTEVGVDPREVIRRMPFWLQDTYGVRLHYGTAIDSVAMPRVSSTCGECWSVDRTIIASRTDFQTLYPKAFAQAGFQLCKLQMMRTATQPGGWQLGPTLAGGLTLRHYEAFAVCESLRPLRERIAAESPELERYGIHVLVAQNGAGEVIIGDSHEYGDQVSPFDKAEIDELVLRELRSLMDLPSLEIAQRWHGVYPKIRGTAQFEQHIEPGVDLVIASGGCGMTMSFGFADQMWFEASEPVDIDCQNSVGELTEATES